MVLLGAKMHFFGPKSIVWRHRPILQKPALLIVLQAHLPQVHMVGCLLSPCPKYHFMMFQTTQIVHFLKALGPRISKLIFPSVSYTNTRTQIHKYTNTAYNKVPERPNMWYIFEKRIVEGYQKLHSHLSNAQIQKNTITKYTNAQIQHIYINT